MKLGGFFGTKTIDGLGALAEQLDVHGLAAINPPWNMDELDLDDCAAFGEKARSMGMVVGETGVWSNLMIDDADAQAERIAMVRDVLPKADAMGCHCVVTLVGTRDPSDHSLAMDPFMKTDAAKAEFREVVLRILDGFDLKTVRYGIEPWHNTFFYQPEDIRKFIDSVDHPAFGLHLDQMNMVAQEDYYDTTGLINRTFDLLADKVASVHLKDIREDFSHMFLKLDEVYIGDGVMDYDTYLKRLAELPADTPCYCEHMAEEAEYALCFARLHHLADKAGVKFLARGES
ncbi:MAG: sugar phosphate isomerase/epimerase family protein [Planctomycetota bacterium]|jgi:sugar phosphate isomerase/epimerase